MGRHGGDGDQWFIAVMCVLLLAVSAAGLVHSVRGAVAGWIYHSAEFASVLPAPDTRLDLCQRGYKWYPWNYYFSIRAAELAFRQYEASPTNEAAAVWLAKAKLWCERGLVQNRYKSQLIRLQTRLLWPESPAAAIACWEAYTDWNYWNAYNHATLADYYAKAGAFDKAERQLDLIKAFPDYTDTAKAVAAERQTWDRLLHGDGEGWGE